MQWHNGISLRWEIIGCRSDYAISGPLVVDDSKLKASSVLDVGHDAASSRIRPILPSINPSCWKPQSDSTSEYLNVIGSIHIPDDQLNASSVLDPQHSVFRARLNLPANGAYAGAWIPLFSDTHQYMQAYDSYNIIGY
ncbi:hypothetical protein DPMN_114991 [Dreissena polymorpha]|uniref:Uncharacterized protein n=1 Tax=Dreissena polymorpha TaxID=45954 RepID=A0A9D4KM11_DREPO|nr:hypothetical protein DPMN_114991 [Dreissena polymorpha]